MQWQLEAARWARQGHPDEAAGNPLGEVSGSAPWKGCGPEAAQEQDFEVNVFGKDTVMPLRSEGVRSHFGSSCHSGSSGTSAGIMGA
mmetsp:Transcript_2190/g.1747  ORF Transcript_2190/g.1747 Transcript_2190/m.1747 type:complete len:87 (-) Transcript_2190:137-397(-)